MSKLTYREIFEGQKSLHFHEVEFTETKLKSLPEVKTSIQWLLGIDTWNFSEYSRRMRQLYQFAVYTDNQKRKAPRIFGTIDSLGAFKIIWFDLEHQIYSSQV